VEQLAVHCATSLRSVDPYDALISAATAFGAEPQLEGLARALFDRLEPLGAVASALHLTVEHRPVLAAQRHWPTEPGRAAALVTQLALEREPRLLSRVDAPLLADLAAPSEARTAVALPMWAGERSLGVLVVALAGVARDHELRTLGALFAGHLARVLAFADERRLRRRLQLVRAAALELQALEELRPLLARLAERARTLTNASLAAVGLVADDGSLAPWALADHDGGPARVTECGPRLRGLLALPLEGRAVRVADVHADPRFEGVPAEHPAITSVLGVPLRTGDRVMACLHVADPRGGDGFSADDQAALELLAEHAALALTAARRRDEPRLPLATAATDVQALVDRLPDVVYRIRLQPSISVEYVSAGIERLTGRRAEEYLKDPGLLGRGVHPADRPTLEATLRVPELFTHPIEYRVIRVDSSVAWIEARWQPIVENGVTVALEGSMRDVTARKRGEREVDGLLERVSGDRARLQAVIACSPVGIVLIDDPRATTTLANRAAEQLFGFSFEPTGGLLQFTEHLRDKQGRPLPMQACPVVRALAGETLDAVELVIEARDGRRVPVLASAVPLRDSSGAVSGAVVLYKDVSMLRQLEQLREEWTSIVAHDLRQPIAVVRMQAHGLRRVVDRFGAGARLAREQLGHIHDAVAQLERMIADLLDLSRLETKHLELRRREVEPAAMARIVAERLRELVAPHVVDVAIDGELPALELDPERVEQVLTNLVTNAARYGYSDTSITLGVRLQASNVVWSVSNLGPGIPAAELPRLFERFHRFERPEGRGSGLGRGAERGDSAGPSGAAGGAERSDRVGLGLYISRGLVEAHGGRLWAQSERDGRTTFSFTIPLG
jgi:PAS domain S-box-containing protein